MLVLGSEGWGLSQGVIELADAEQKLTSHLLLRVRESDLTRDRLVAVRNLLQAQPGDCAVYLHITIPGESETVLSVGGIRGVDPSDGLRREIDALFPRIDVP